MIEAGKDTGSAWDTVPAKKERERMKKTVRLLMLAALFALLACLSMTACARTVYVIAENFESDTHPFVATAYAPAMTLVESGNPGGALKIAQNKNYASAGIPVKLQKDVAYSYSYDVMPVSYGDGADFADGEKVQVVANFIFTDSKSTNAGKNHPVGTTTVPLGAWTTVTGTYTAKSTSVAADADMDNAFFALYANPAVSAKKPVAFLVDNVRLTYTDDQPLDGENYLKNGSFEDTEHIEFTKANGTNVTLAAGNIDAMDGIFSLEVTSVSGYGHAGMAVMLEEGRTYEYSYYIKIVSDNAGAPVSSPVAIYTNFVFPDSKANKEKNHLIKSAAASSSSGWVHVTGTYTPTFGAIADDADLASAWFTVYTNPSGSRGTVWLIDDVVFKRRPLDYLPSEIELPALLSDNMLIQQDKEIHIWGSFGGADEITVTLRNGSAVLSEGTLAVTDGRFDGYLDAVQTPAAGLVLDFRADGETVKTVNNVAVGELWHFSGQSNMAAKVSACGTYTPELVPQTDMPLIRYFNAGEDGSGSWKIASRDNVYGMSAIGYKAMETIFYGLDGEVPVGGIHTAVGGKKMSNFTGPCRFSANGGDLYLSRVFPVTKVAVRGQMWFQGTSDAATSNFADQFEELIRSWRTAWNDPDQPFLFVQNAQSAATIPDWWGALDANGNPTRTSTYDCTKVRFWQNELYERMRDEHVGMVVTFDTNTHIDELKSIENKNAQDPLHPWNKAPIGVRLGNTALHDVYGKTAVRHLCPYPSSVTAVGSVVTVTFDGAYDGLGTTDGAAPKFFEIADENGNYFAPDTVEIVAPNAVRLSSASVPAPAKVAYCYENHFVDMSKAFVGMEVNFVNSENLPVSPFFANVIRLSDLAPESRPAETRYTEKDVQDGDTVRHTTGIRFVSGVSMQKHVFADEYGFLVTRKTFLGDAPLTFDFPDLAVSGKAYDKATGLDIRHATDDDGTVAFSGYLYGIPAGYEDDVLVARPYLKSGDTVFYGDAMEGAVSTLKGE